MPVPVPVPEQGQELALAQVQGWVLAQGREWGQALAPERALEARAQELEPALVPVPV